MTGDWGQHVMGWLLFRQAPWGVPLGELPNYGYPVGTSIALTDSLPLLSLSLKPLSTLLPDDFQFVGVWLAFCFVMQGVFGARLCALLTSDRLAAALGGMLFVTAPVLSHRVGHDTLCAQFLVLWALGLYLSAPRRGTRSLGVSMVACVVCAALTHPYLWAMCAPICLALLVRLRQARRLGVPGAAAIAAVLLATSLVIFRVLGLIGEGIETGVGGIGSYASDLLTFVSPMASSRWIPALPQSEGAYEGFGYLGIGVIGLFAVAAWCVARRRPSPEAWRPLLPLAICVGVMALFAFSNQWRVAGFTVFSFRGISAPVAELLSPLRATGRFIWPLAFLTTAAGVRAATRCFGERRGAAAGLLAAALLVQVVEAEWPGVSASVERSDWYTLDDDALAPMASGRRHVAQVPVQIISNGAACDSGGFPQGFHLESAYFAYRHRMTTNSGYFARTRPAVTEACATFEAQVRLGILRDDTVYLVAPTWLDVVEPFAECARVSPHAFGCTTR